MATREDHARLLLRALLDEHDGEIPARRAIDEGARRQLSERTVRRAARSLNLHPKRLGWGPGSTLVWREHEPTGA